MNENNENIVANTETLNIEAPFGLKLDGTPKQKPGRKPGRKATGRTVYVADGKVLGVGRPSLKTLRNRLVVVLAPGENYDPAVHVGTRNAEDDVALAQWEQAIAQREQAKAAKVAAVVAAESTVTVAAPVDATVTV